MHVHPRQRGVKYKLDARNLFPAQRRRKQQRHTSHILPSDVFKYSLNARNLFLAQRRRQQQRHKSHTLTSDVSRLIILPNKKPCRGSVAVIRDAEVTLSEPYRTGMKNIHLKFCEKALMAKFRKPVQAGSC